MCARFKVQLVMTFTLTIFCVVLNASAEDQCQVLCITLGSTGKSNVGNLRRSLRSLPKGYDDICSLEIREMEKKTLFWEKLCCSSKLPKDTRARDRWEG